MSRPEVWSDTHGRSWVMVEGRARRFDFMDSSNFGMTWFHLTPWWKLLLGSFTKGGKP